MYKIAKNKELTENKGKKMSFIFGFKCPNGVRLSDISGRIIPEQIDLCLFDNITLL